MSSYSQASHCSLLLKARNGVFFCSIHFWLSEADVLLLLKCFRAMVSLQNIFQGRNILPGLIRKLKILSQSSQKSVWYLGPVVVKQLGLTLEMPRGSSGDTWMAASLVNLEPVFSRAIDGGWRGISRI